MTTLDAAPVRGRAPWSTDRGLWLVVLVTLAAVASAAAEMGSVVGAAGGGLVTWLPLVMDLGLGALAWRVGRSDTLGPAIRRAWRLIGLAAWITAVGDLVGVIWAVSDPSSAPVRSLCYLAAAGLVLAGLYAFPLGRRSRQDRVTALLDSSIVVLGGVIATWVLLLEPGMAAGRSPAWLLLGTLGPLGGLISLLGTARLAVNPHQESHPLPNVIVIFAMLGFFTASLGGACAAGLGVRWTVGPMTFCLLSTVLLASAAWLQARLPSATAEAYRDRFAPFLVHARARWPGRHFPTRPSRSASGSRWMPRTAATSSSLPAWWQARPR